MLRIVDKQLVISRPRSFIVAGVHRANIVPKAIVGQTV